MNPVSSGAPLLADLYPQVLRLMLFVAFEEADAEAEPNYQQIIFGPDSEAAFRLDCSRDECAGGGFDYAPAIAALIQGGAERAHDKIVCAGRLGSGADAPRCDLQSEFRIIVQYLP